MVLAPHPADLDGVDGRIFSPRRSGREPLASARASPVSPATPYGKEDAELAMGVPASRSEGPERLLTAFLSQ